MAAPAAGAPSAAVLNEWLDMARVGLWNPMEDLLNRGVVSVDAREAHSGMSALLICAEEGHADCAERLLAAGARIDQTDTSGRTALMLAAEAGSVGVISALFAAAEASDVQDISVNAQDSLGETAVLKAVRAGELAAVQALVEYEEQRCDLELSDNRGDTPLLVAVQATPDDTGVAAAARPEDDPALAVLDYLLNNPRTRARIAGYNKTTGLSALHVAVLGGKLAALRMLVAARGADVDRQDLDRYEETEVEEQSAAEIAAGSGAAAAAAAAAAKKKRADVPRKRIPGGNTPIHLAVSDPDLPLDFLKALLPLCTSPAPAAATTASAAAASSSSAPAASASASSAVSTLCRKNNSGYTALHLAVRNGALGSVELLLASEVAARQGLPSTRVLDGEFGWSALQHAAAKGDRELVKALCEAQDKGLDVDLRDRRGSNALQLAARFGHLGAVKFLVKHKASLTSADAAGSTALMDALCNGHGPVVAFLLEKGAVVIQKDVRGGHALHRLAEKASLTLSAVEQAQKVLEQHPAAADPSVRAKLVHEVNSEGETSWSIARAKAAEGGGLTGPHAALASLLSSWAAKVPPPPVAEITSVSAAGDGALVVSFRPHKNAAFMLADLTYEATAEPRTTQQQASSATTTSKVSSSSSSSKDAKSSATAGAVKKPKDASAATPVKIAEPKVRTSSVKKASSTKKSTTSSSSSSAFSSSFVAAGPSAASSSSSSKLRESVLSGSSASPYPSQSVRGSFSPLRIGNLVNGVSYAVSLVCSNGAGACSPTYWAGGSLVVVGTPESPVITQVVQGANWASVSFLSGGSSRTTAVGTMASNGAAAAANAQSAVQEFILTATVHTINPRHSAPPSALAAMTAAATAGSSNPMRRVVSAVSSPILLTALAPGLSYSLSLRARNGFGDGAPTAQPKLITVAAAAVGAASSSSGGSAAVSPSALAATAAQKHLMWLTPSVDAAELAECNTLLSQSLSAELQMLLKQSRNAAAGLAAAGVSSPGGASSHASPPPVDGLRVVRAAKLSNAALSSAFDAAASFVQSLGCSRHDSARTQMAFVLLESGPRGKAQMDSIAVNGLLPWAHPLSAPFLSTAAPAAATGTEPSYNHNVYPVGSPYRGVYVSLHLTRSMLLASDVGSGSRSSAAAAAGEGNDGALHRVVICRVLPGRTRSTATDAATSAAAAATPTPANGKPARPSSARPSSARPASAASAAAAASAASAAASLSTLPRAAQSTSFDSHQSPSGASLFLYSSAQVLPLYAVEFILPPSVLAAAAGAATLTADEAQLERDALEQGGVLAGEAAPLREDPLAALRHAAASAGAADDDAQKWMGGAPSSSLEPPGELSSQDVMARNAPSSSAASAAAAAAAAARLQDDEQDGERNRRSRVADGDEDDEPLDITTTHSSLLGPMGNSKAATKKNAAAPRR